MLMLTKGEVVTMILIDLGKTTYVRKDLIQGAEFPPPDYTNDDYTTGAYIDQVRGAVYLTDGSIYPCYVNHKIFWRRYHGKEVAEDTE